MRARCRIATGHRHQCGAALIIGLVLVMAVALLTSAALHEVTLEAAKTAHLAAHVQAELSAASAVDLALAAGLFPASGTRALQFRLGPDSAYSADVTIRFLGTGPLAPDPAAEDSTAPTATDVAASYYEVVAEVRGPRGAYARRKRDWRRIEPQTM